MMFKIVCENRITGTMRRIICITMTTFIFISNLEFAAAEVTATAYGYSHIKTLSGHEYSFNGKGEYLFLDLNNGTFTIQIRTDYVVAVNKDVTMITAVALKTKDSCVAELHLNKSQTAIDVFLDGVYYTTPSQPTRCGMIMFVPTKEGAIGFVFPGNTLAGKLIQGFKVSTQMFALRLEIDTRDLTGVTTKGLAGSEQGAELVCRDSSTILSSSTEEQLYNFCDSWSLQSVNESLFNYSIVTGNFSSMNDHRKPDRFPEDLANTNITALFSQFSNANITDFQHVCKGDVQCLAAIAVDGDVSRGSNYMKAIGEERHKDNALKDKPPKFMSNASATVVVTIGDIYTLTLTSISSDSDTILSELKYNVTTRPALNYTLEGGIFTWYVGAEGRNAEGRNESVSLTFLVLDDYNKVGQPYAPDIHYCGCRLRLQCLYNESEAAGDKFRRIRCHCGDSYTGTFCQDEVDKCNVTVCYTGVECNSSKPGPNPCGACPNGLDGDGMACTDIDECQLRPSPCEYCTNTDGSFKCSCPANFTLNMQNPNKQTCEDINECELNMLSCGRNEFCLNTPGSARCDCLPGYRRQAGSTCMKTEGYAYVGVLVLLVSSNSATSLDTDRINTDANRQTMENKLTGIFNSTKGFLYVEVTSITIVPGDTPRTSRFRRASADDTCNVQYIIHLINQTDSQALQADMNKLLDSSSSIAIGVLETRVKAIKIYSDKDSMLCTIPDRTGCDTLSTNCRGTNASFVCDCKPGFRTVLLSDKYCRDINECSDLGGHTCHGGGTCVNTPGNWTCVCPNGYEPQSVTKSNMTCIDIDECNDDSYMYVCEHGNCANTVGGWSCECNPGFRRRTIAHDPYICDDINECSDGSYSCSGGHCYNSPGSWSCQCEPGYINTTDGQYDVSCDDINECEHSYACLEDTGDCVNTPGSWKCFCKDGLEPKQINETSQICGGVYQYVAVMTVMVKGSVYYIDTVRYVLQIKITELYQSLSHAVYIEITSITEITGAISKRDTDFSKKINITYVIHVDHYVSERQLKRVWTTYKNNTCNNSSGCPEEKSEKYRLVYVDSYLPHQQGRAEGLCNIPNKNHCDAGSADCEVYNGTTGCVCKNGFDKSSEFQCKDIDECQDATSHHCNGGRCHNIPGNWACVCGDGYEPDTQSYNVTNRTCVDVDECSYSFSDILCLEGNCSNTQGGYLCLCAEGFKSIHVGPVLKHCVDIDECQDATSHHCNGGRCHNIPGNWACVCEDGYEPDTQSYTATNRTCVDLCEGSSCSEGSTCERFNNTDGYICHCADGRGGDYCQIYEVDEEASKLKKTLIGVGGGAGGIIALLILAIVGIFVYMRRSSKKAAADQFLMKPLDKGVNRSDSFPSPFPHTEAELYRRTYTPAATTTFEKGDKDPPDPAPDQKNENIIPGARPHSMFESLAETDDSGMSNGYGSQNRARTTDDISYL